MQIYKLDCDIKVSDQLYDVFSIVKEYRLIHTYIQKKPLGNFQGRVQGSIIQHRPVVTRCDELSAILNGCFSFTIQSAIIASKGAAPLSV